MKKHNSMPNRKLVRQDIIYPELSYKIVGSLFSVFNEIGSGHHEKYYQRAVARALADSGLQFKEQFFVPLEFRGEVIGKNFFDFLIDDKIILEIKKDRKFSKRHVDQVNRYLKISGKQLAILANFDKNGVTFKRFVNIQK